MAATDTPEDDAAASAGSPIKAIGVVVLLTLIAIGVGALVGTRLVGDVKDALAQAAGEGGEEEAEPLYIEQTNLRRLEPIVSNLASPSETWVRIEASLLLADEPLPEDDVLVAQVAQDITSYVHTLSLAQLEGVGGLLNLREDLNDRAEIRSGGRVRELIIESLVVQ